MKNSIWTSTVSNGKMKPLMSLSKRILPSLLNVTISFVMKSPKWWFSEKCHFTLMTYLLLEWRSKWEIFCSNIFGTSLKNRNTREQRQWHLSRISHIIETEPFFSSRRSWRSRRWSNRARTSWSRPGPSSSS